MFRLEPIGFFVPESMLNRVRERNKNMKSKYLQIIDEKTLKSACKKVDQFLESEPLVAEKICDLFDLAEKHMGEIVKYVLMTETDPESCEPCVTLWLYIYAKISVDGSLAMEDKIDYEWYLGLEPLVRDKFNYQIFPANRPV